MSNNIEQAKENIHRAQDVLNSLKPKDFTIVLPNTTITDKDLYHIIKGHADELNPTEYTKVGQLIQNSLIEILEEITTRLQNSGIIKEDYHKETLKNNLYLLSRDIIHKILTNEIYNLRVPTLTIEILKQLYNPDLETLKY